MLNLQIFTVIIMTKKNIKKSCDSRDLNPGYMGSKFTKISTKLWRPMQITDKNNLYILKL